MMLGQSIPEYIFIRVAIAALWLVAPLSVLWAAYMLLTPPPAALDPKWAPFYSLSLVYASLEAAFFVCVYLPRRYHLQKAANHPILSRRERQALFERCSAYRGSADYPSGWFFHARGFQRQNVVEWLLWALFSTPMNARREEWEDEIETYVATVERVLGRTLPDGYNKDTPCMRPTLDPVRMVHRPLLWYWIVGVVDFAMSVKLYSLGFRHYSDERLFRSFPLRPLTLFSRSSGIEGLSYWYRPHRSLKENPVLFLHGIGIGLYPYAAFFADLASRYPDAGIIVPEFLPISSRITFPPLSRSATLAAITQILDTHALPRVVVAAHSYGTAVTAQLLRSPSFAPRIAATLLVDPIPILLHFPDVAHNFVYRAPGGPRRANEWLLWYFASRDPDVARTLARHFFWAENVLWREEICGRDLAVAVALSGRDQVVNAEAVRRYLTGEDVQRAYWRGGYGCDGGGGGCGRGGACGHDGHLEVLWYAELDHAMIFDTRARRARLVRVLDRFVRERN